MIIMEHTTSRYDQATDNKFKNGIFRQGRSFGKPSVQNCIALGQNFQGHMKSNVTKIDTFYETFISLVSPLWIENYGRHMWRILSQVCVAKTMKSVLWWAIGVATNDNMAKCSCDTGKIGWLRPHHFPPVITEKKRKKWSSGFETLLRQNVIIFLLQSMLP